MKIVRVSIVTQKTITVVAILSYDSSLRVQVKNATVRSEQKC